MFESVVATLDVRAIMPFERHALIFSHFSALQLGEALQLVNDHDPKPLFNQLQAVTAGRFTWDYLESGPALWRVRIGKPTAAVGIPPASSGSCCSGGSCG